jgi:phosphoribosylaminoimidazole carboxylase PurE protein
MALRHRIEGSEMNVTVGILMGSASDLPVMESVGNVLDELGIGWEMRILSAHRTPDEVHEYATTAPQRGLKVLIAGAGMSAALSGVLAGNCNLPVIGVPLGANLASGLDAVYATLQMPPGIPVAAVAVGKAGAKNAAWLAARILALVDADVATRLAEKREEMRVKVLQTDADLQTRLGR